MAFFSALQYPTDHAADGTGAGAGVAPLPGHTAYEAHMYRYHQLPQSIAQEYHHLLPPPVTTRADLEYLAMFTDDIKSLRPQVDVLIASCHWNLGKEVLTYMEQIAKAAIDAGADVVMGHGGIWGWRMETGLHYSEAWNFTKKTRREAQKYRLDSLGIIRTMRHTCLTQNTVAMLTATSQKYGATL